MAADTHSDASHNTGTAMDYAEHEKTFGLFAGLIKWGIVASLAIVLIAGAASGTVSWFFALIVIAAMIAVIVKMF